VRACPLCDETRVTSCLETDLVSSSNEPYQIVACANCGLRYTRPVLTSPAELAILYGNEYHTSKTSRLYGFFLEGLCAERRKFLVGLQPGRILDLGCGNGEFLRGLAERGWDAYGVDLSAAACDLSTSRGIQTHCGTLASAAFPSESFDVVTSWHVLEHLPEPRTDLVEVRRVLRGDGLFVVEVPNCDSLTSRLCGKHWYHFDVPRHLQHFNRATLQRLLEENGFTPLYARNYHRSNFTAAFHSYLNKLGLRKRLRLQTISRDIGSVSPLSKLTFALVALPLGGLSILYSLAALLVTGNGESITIVARRSNA
jgi:2-polyprenyl-3-methyl-5-hydroxy-6-metoxy-1,4-benzoquinol methylase